jgi:hypothetical protein
MDSFTHSSQWKGCMFLGGWLKAAGKHVLYGWSAIRLLSGPRQRGLEFITIVQDVVESPSRQVEGALSWTQGGAKKHGVKGY